MSYQRAIERGIELLTLCQQLQSEKDGVDRPAPGVIDKTKTPDSFAQDIMESISYLSALYRLIPLSQELEDLGRMWEREGKINVKFGDSYAEAALAYLRTQYHQK